MHVVACSPTHGRFDVADRPIAKRPVGTQIAAVRRPSVTVLSGEAAWNSVMGGDTRSAGHSALWLGCVK